MARLVTKQPDGNYAVFSTVVDAFILIDATEEQVEEFLMTERIQINRREVNSTITLARTDKNYLKRYENFKAQEKRVHGDEELEHYKGSDVQVEQTYISSELADKIREFTEYIIPELGLTQYPKKTYLDVTEAYIKTIE